MFEGWSRTRALSLFSGGLVAAALALAPTSAVAQDPWVQSALDDQYELAGDVPLVNAPWVGTHNSFNSLAEMGPALSTLDANQLIDLTSQLKVGVRSLELDLHWLIRLNPLLQRQVVVCHGRTPDQLNFGCTVEKKLDPILKEIAAWLNAPANDSEVLLLYLEDDMPAGAAPHNAAAAVIQSRLGSLVYQPPGGGCTQLPTATLTREQVLAAGAQIVIVSGCAASDGSGWQGQVFDWGAHLENRPVGYRDYPDCGPDYTRAQYDGSLVRYFEDTTFLTNGIGPIPGLGTRDERLTAATTAAMTRCGVDLFGFDKLRRIDPRLESAVWSWAPGEPGAGYTCAVQRSGAAVTAARWYGRGCAASRRPVCRNGATWLVGPNSVPAALAPAECAALGAVHAVPRTGYEAQLLRQAMVAAGVARAWLGYRRVGAHWVALD